MSTLLEITHRTVQEASGSIPANAQPSLWTMDRLRDSHINWRSVSEASRFRDRVVSSIPPGPIADISNALSWTRQHYSSSHNGVAHPLYSSAIHGLECEVASKACRTERSSPWCTCGVACTSLDHATARISSTSALLPRPRQHILAPAKLEPRKSIPFRAISQARTLPWPVSPSAQQPHWRYKRIHVQSV